MNFHIVTKTLPPIRQKTIIMEIWSSNMIWLLLIETAPIVSDAIIL